MPNQSDSHKQSALAAKQAYVARTRVQNYRASLRLEGFEVQEDGERQGRYQPSKQRLVDKYRMAAS